MTFTTIIGASSTLPPMSCFWFLKVHNNSIFFNIDSTKVSNVDNMLFVFFSPSWEPKDTFPKTMSSCHCVMTQGMSTDSTLALAKFIVDILDILSNFLIVIIDTPQVLVPSTNIKQFSWGTRTALEIWKSLSPRQWYGHPMDPLSILNYQTIPQTSKV